MSEPTAHRRHRAERASILVLLVLSLAFLALHAAYYLPFIADDALISLRYSRHLLEGQGLVWSEGQPVEGYSNLLWVLLAALLGAFGLDLIVASRILGFVGFALLFLVVTRAPRSDQNGPAAAVGVGAGLLFLAFSGPVAVWTIGGMEQPLLAALLGCALVLFSRVLEGDPRPRHALPLASLALGLLCLTRPDGALFTVAALISLLLLQGANRGTLIAGARLVALPALCYGGQLAFRLAYYGEWVPNTARVKLAPSLDHAYLGLVYLAKGFLALAPLSIFAVSLLPLLLAVRRHRPMGVLLLVNGGLWGLYLVFIGGDIFPAYRHFVPLIVIAALALVRGTALAWERAGSRGRTTIVVVYPLLLLAFAMVQFTGSENRRAIEEVWEWDGQVVGLFLADAFGEQRPLFAVTAAGCLPYWSELPALDMLGLNDHYLPRHRPEEAGSGFVGHELGDGRYVLDRKPDLVSFCGPLGAEGACFRSGREMLETDEFHESYVLVRFMARRPRRAEFRVWARVWSEKIGIRREEGRLVIPAFLLTANAETVAYLNGDGELVVTVAPQRGVGITLAASTLPPGEWRLEPTPESVGKLTADWTEEPDGSRALTLTTEEPGGVELREIRLRLQNGTGSDRAQLP